MKKYLESRIIRVKEKLLSTTPTVRYATGYLVLLIIETRLIHRVCVCMCWCSNSEGLIDWNIDLIETNKEY